MVMAFAMLRKPDNVAGSSAPAIMIGAFIAFGGVSVYGDRAVDKGLADQMSGGLDTLRI